MPIAALPDEETPNLPVPHPSRAAVRRRRQRKRRLTAASIAIGVAAAATLVGAVVTLATGGSGPDGPQAAPTVASGAPILLPEVRNEIPDIPDVKAVEMGPMQQHLRIKSRDNGQSVLYGGQSIWVFADTLLRDPWGFISNTAAATTDLTAADGITLTASDLLGTAGGTPTEFLPRSAAELDFERSHKQYVKCAPGVHLFCNVSFGYWPGPVIADPARQRVLVFYEKLCRGGEPCLQPYGRTLGSGVAALDVRTHQVTRLPAHGGTAVTSIEGSDPTMIFPGNHKYNAAALTLDDDVYVYGDCSTRCRLTKAPLADLTNRAAWQYYAGRDYMGVPIWSKDPDDAVRTIDAGGAGNTVLWNPALRSWMNIFMPFGSNVLKAQVGGSPWGPWSPQFDVLATNTGGKSINYAAYAHPEYAEQDGLVQYVNYYQNSTGAQRLVRVQFTPQPDRAERVTTD